MKTKVHTIKIQHQTFGVLMNEGFVDATQFKLFLKMIQGCIELKNDLTFFNGTDFLVQEREPRRIAVRTSQVADGAHGERIAKREDDRDRRCGLHHAVQTDPLVRAGDRGHALAVQRHEGVEEHDGADAVGHAEIRRAVQRGDLDRFKGCEAGLAQQLDFAIVGVFGDNEYGLRDLLAETQKAAPDYSKVPGIAFRKDGEVVLTPARPLLTKLDDLPMPAHLNPDKRAKRRIVVGEPC